MKRILLVFLLALTVFAANLKEARAQETSSPWLATPNSLEDAFNKKSPALENLTVFNGSSIVAQLAVMAVGLPPENSQGQTRTPQERGGGLVGTMGNLSLAMTQQPGGTSTREYIADLGHDLGVVPKEALAQGTGFSSLSPILIIWKTTRDAVYLFYVVIFMVVGFMILLRKKIDPRTVITIEAALPRLVIGLILVTFSYAIISFMVDLANLATRVIAFLFFKKILFTDDTSYTYALQNIFNANIFQLARPIGDVYKIVGQVGQILDPNKFDIGVEFVKGLIQGATLLVFGFAVLFITFKIFFSLLGPYVGIVLAVILSPFEILMTALPGSEATLTNWIKNILSKVAVFPVVFFMLLLAATFGAYDSSVCANGSCFEWHKDQSIQSQVQNIPLIMTPLGNWGGVVGSLIAFGILFTIPATTQLVQDALKVKDKSADIAGQTIMKGLSKVPLMKGITQ